jgi:hypothetical protein
MQYLILLSALMSLATVVMAQDVDTVFEDQSEALPLDGPVCSEPASGALADMNEMEVV